MKLVTKGLLIVAVPVVMQVFLITLMSIMLYQAHKQEVFEANAKDVVDDCHQLIMHSMTLAKQSHGLEGDQTFSKQDAEMLSKDLESIKSRLSPAEQNSADFKKLESISSNYIPFLIRVQNHEFEENGSRFRSERLLFKASDEYMEQVMRVVSFVESGHSNDVTARAQRADQIRFALTCFVIASIVLSIALAYFASITIRRPLELMVKNAENISRRVELEPEIGGRDELSALDSLLHQVDTSIDEALTTERNLITNAADLVCSIDKNGLFQSVNPYSHELLGYSPEWLVGSSIIDVVVSTDCDKVDQLLTSRTQSAGTTTVEVRMQTRDKTFVDTSWSAIWSERDSTLFCVIHDITERKAIERLKQDFLAMISHDLRTPLMSVNSSLDLVQSGAMGPLLPTTETQLISASRNTEHLIDLVNDLLDFEKLEAGRMDFDQTKVVLHDVYEETQQLVKALSDKMRVRIFPPKQTLSAYCDHRKLVQVLVNLSSNALKHSPEGGMIRIENKTVGKFVEISVHDQGPGVPEEYRQSIFAPFEQINSRATAALGTGLGLAICRLIVEGQGGKIGVRSSEILNGSAFWLTMPIGSKSLFDDV
ncbi:MAG TPA: ATP-binding protein [Drouetiella sp.]